MFGKRGLAALSNSGAKRFLEGYHRIAVQIRQITRRLYEVEGILGRIEGPCT
jgi:hypothetical protein